MALAVVLEQSPGAGREILQARPHREDDIRLFGQSVCGRGAVNADRAHVERMVGRKRGLARLRLGDWNAMGFGELRQCRAGAGIEYAAAGDDQRLVGLAKLRDRGTSSSSSDGRMRRKVQMRSAKKASG